MKQIEISVFYWVFHDVLFVSFFRLEIEVFADDSNFIFAVHFLSLRILQSPGILCRIPGD